MDVEIERTTAKVEIWGKQLNIKLRRPNDARPTWAM